MGWAKGFSREARAALRKKDSRVGLVLSLLAHSEHLEAAERAVLHCADVSRLAAPLQLPCVCNFGLWGKAMLHVKELRWTKSFDRLLSNPLMKFFILCPPVSSSDVQEEAEREAEKDEVR